MLHYLICRKNKLKIKNKLLFYKAIIKPITIYATPVWSSTYKSNIMKIQRIQNKIIREATDRDHRTSNIDIQTQGQIKDIYEEIYEQTDLFYKELRLPILNDIGKINKLLHTTLNLEIGKKQKLMGFFPNFYPKVNINIYKINSGNQINHAKKQIAH